MRLLSIIIASVLLAFPVQAATTISGGTLSGASIPASEPIAGGSGNWPGDALACNDGVDNDSDGVADWPGDAGCTSPYDNNESGDSLVVVSGTISNANLNTCIGGSSSPSACDNVGGAAAAVTVCSGSGSTCDLSGTRYDVTGALSPSQGNVSYNHLTATGISNFGESKDHIHIVDSYINGDGFMEGSDYGVLFGNHFDGNPDNAGCSVSGPVLYIQCNDSNGGDCSGTPRGQYGWKILNNWIEDYFDDCRQGAGGCGVSPDFADHSEAFYLGDRTFDMLIKGNDFLYNGSTGHVFFTWWPISRGGNICVTDNTFGATGDQWGECGPIGGGDHNAIFDVQCHDGQGSWESLIRVPSSTNSFTHGVTTGSSGTACGPSGQVLATCASFMQCNDGIDNDGDGRADYWPDGNGDSGCSSASDNSE